MKTHKVKIQEEYLIELLAGRKKAEVRLNDRDYQMGDVLKFYRLGSGAFYTSKITHIHSGLGMENNYVILSITKPKLT